MGVSLFSRQRKRSVVNSSVVSHRFAGSRGLSMLLDFSSRFRAIVRPLFAAHFPLVYAYRRDLFSYIEEINDKPITSRPSSSRSSSPVVPRSIHMHGPYVCNRIVNSEHGPRVPVPLFKYSIPTHPDDEHTLVFVPSLPAPCISSRVNSGFAQFSRLGSYVPLGIFYKLFLIINTVS